MSIKKELTYDDFRALASNNELSTSEKIGFPDLYRKGFSEIILEDIYTKLPVNKTQNKLIIDIGCGCDELTLKLIEECKKNNHTLVLIDSDEMLTNIKDSEGIVKIAGKFPFLNNEIKDYIGKADFVLCYSVLFYVFANDNIYNFLHEAVNLLKSGGKFLIGDIPNIDKRDRFLNSEEGKAFLTKNISIEGSTAHDNRIQKMDDSIVLAIMDRFRRFGCETYLLPQMDNLPMSNRREDILMVKR